MVGPSGCGKSTLLRLIGGLIRPTSGRIEISASPGGPSTAIVFQDGALYPWKTVLANVRLGLDLAGTPRQEADLRAMAWIDRLGLGEFTAAYPSVLSGGMRQRAAIARALVMEIGTLLMDEPFASVDAQMRRLLQEELLALWERDRRTVVFVTHSVEEAILLGSRVVVLSARPGRAVADLPVPFEHPRGRSLRASASFAALEAEVWELLSPEVEANRAAGGSG